MDNYTGSIHHGPCHDFYIGTAPYTIINKPNLRLDIIEVVNMIPTALFFLWLLFTIPWSVRRFLRGRKGQAGLVAYFGLMWATAIFRSLRFVILWAFMGGDAPAHITTAESVLYILYLATIDTVEFSFLLLFANGIFGSPKWLDRRVIIQSACIFILITTTQLLLTFIGKYSLLEDDNPRNAPFWFASEFIFTLAYFTVIMFKFLPGSRDRFPPSRLIPVYLILLMLMHGLTAIGQALIMTNTKNAFCPLIVGNVAYYYLASPLLYCTFLGAYLHPGCCEVFSCGGSKMRYSIIGDDSMYDYQPVDTLPTVKNWIPPTQLNISSPYYPRNASGYFSSSTSLSEAEFNSAAESARTTGESDYDFSAPEAGYTVN
jgi:hypothetical protein